MRDTLFRREASGAKDQGWLGEVVLQQPLSLRLLSWGLVSAIAALMLFMCLASYTRRVAAAGVLAPDAGLVKVQSPRDGVVTRKLVLEGQQVGAGELLYVVSSEVAYVPAQQGRGATGVVATTLDTVRARQQLLDQDAHSSAAVASAERVQAGTRVGSLRRELAQIDAEIEIQQERLRSKQAQHERNELSQRQGFISQQALQQKYDDILDQRARVQSMQRSRLGVELELASATSALANFDRKTGLLRSQLRREELETSKQQVEQEASGQIAVTAPTAGVVAAVLAQPGQRVRDQTLLTILPRGSRLEAQLLMRPNAIGFIRKGDPVELRFSAFPSATARRFAGEVIEVSSTTLAGLDLQEQGLAGVADAGQGAFYRVRVKLSAQAISVAGAAHPLRSGMEVEALFPQESKSLMAWLLAPVLRLRDKA